MDASKVVALFLSAGSAAQLSTFSDGPVVQWLNGTIRFDTAITPRNVLGLRCAAALFRSRRFRLAFLASEGIDFVCEYVAQKTTNGLTADALYRATFALWSLSYHDEAVAAVCAHNITVHLIAKNLPHMDDKISRLGLATLVNLLNKEDAEQGVALNDVRTVSTFSFSLCICAPFVVMVVVNVVVVCGLLA